MKIVMPIPAAIKVTVDKALALVEQQANHDYSPAKRKRLLDAFRGLNTSTADQA